MKNDAIIIRPEITPIIIPDNWDYEKSVKKVQGFVFKWKNLNEEIRQELHVARQILSSHYHRDGNKFPSWAQYCHDIGVEKRTVNGWLALPAHVAHASGENEWYTPSEYVEPARIVMGEIDCDPASSKIANRIIQAKKFYTVQDDGLKQKWGKRIWMNPPYAQPLISEFCEAVTARYESGEIEQACVLVNNATETAHFQRMLEAAMAICLIRGRIKYLDKTGIPNKTPLQGQIILYFGKDWKMFQQEYSSLGTVLHK